MRIELMGDGRGFIELWSSLKSREISEPAQLILHCTALPVVLAMSDHWQGRDGASFEIRNTQADRLPSKMLLTQLE